MKSEDLLGIPYVKKDFDKALYGKSLKHYRFYNVDFNPNAYAFHRFKKKKYKEASYDTKLLNKSYYDIEVYIETGVFPDPEKANRPVNAIACYNNMNNKCSIYYLEEVTVIEKGRMMKHIPDITDHAILTEHVLEGYQQLCKDNPNYIVPDLKIELLGYKNEKQLLMDFFQDRINERSLFLIGFNSNLFDNPYVFNRMINLTSPEEARNIVSQFGELSNRGNYFKLPDYLLIDILDLYKPVDQGGAGYGKSLPNYKLNTVIKKELDMKKLELAGGFNENYLHNLPNFLLYNMIDVLPIVKLDRKLQTLELLWSLNSYNDSIMSATTGGRSLMYTFRNNLHYINQDQLLRYTKLNKEIHFSLN